MVNHEDNRNVSKKKKNSFSFLFVKSPTISERLGSWVCRCVFGAAGNSLLLLIQTSLSEQSMNALRGKDEIVQNQQNGAASSLACDL